MRLDLLLVQRGVAETRAKAQALIRRGAIRIEGRPSLKASLDISPDEAVQVLENEFHVARSAAKLIAALDHFDLSPAGRTCLDSGASTGGFTQVLLERGASRVYAVDVGRDQLHAILRNDPRVVSWEKTDLRALTAARFGHPIEAISLDLSFISLLKVLPSVFPLAVQGAWLAALVKPQFEVGRAMICKGGIVKDESAKRAAAERVSQCIQTAGWTVLGTLPSPIKGQDGNEETLLAARRDG